MRIKHRFAALGMAFAICTMTLWTAFPAGAASLSPVRMWGAVTKESDTMLGLDNQNPSGYQGQILLKISEETRILDAVSRMPVAADSLRDGETIYAYAGQIMTASLPPQMNADLILARIPADYKVPSYIQVKSMEKAGEGYSLTSIDDQVFQVPQDCSLTPYLTRNMIYPENLYEGARCLVWSDQNGNASRIMMFPPYYQESEESELQGPGLREPGNQEAQNQKTGWILQSGTEGASDAQWVYYLTDSTQARGWLLDQEDGKWYYLNPETGIMERGFIHADGKTYYLQQDGSMLTEARTFTPDQNGALN